ncbi:hypothetical protein TYRP_017505 [Tyrophagus putrescentiae]|nr:hypothetical protein TYRP_017505 [Tyrophagus putrescentiae]
MPAHLYNDSFAQSCYSKFSSCNHKYTLLSKIQHNDSTEKITTNDKSKNNANIMYLIACHFAKRVLLQAKQIQWFALGEFAVSPSQYLH